MITITPRGYAFKGASSATLGSDTFTPAANSLLFLVHYTDYISGSGDGCIESISGHGAWSLVFQFVFGGLAIEVWGCLVGGSPGSAQIVATNGYAWRSECEFFEAGGDVDRSGGTVASCFGVNASGSEYFTGSGQTLNLTLGAFANAAGLTFVVGAGHVVNSMGAGYTLHTQRNSSGWYLRTGYLAAEDNSIEIVGGAWTTVRGAAFEIKGTSGGGTTHDLAGAAAAAAQAAASLAITKALSASSTGGVAVGAAIAHGVPLAGQATVGVGSTADLQTIGDASLAGAASIGASAQSAIALIVPIAGAATAGASGTAALAHIVTLAGAAVSAVGAAAGVTHGVPLAGAASAGAVTSDGTLLVAITLQGHAVLGALGSANLDTVGDGSLSGSAAGGVGAQAQLALDLHLGGAAFGGVQGATTIGLTVPLAAAAVAAAQADGLLTVVVGLAGASSGRVTSIAALGVSVELGGQAAIGIGVNAAFPSSGAAIVRTEFAALRMRSLAIELRARHADFRLT